MVKQSLNKKTCDNEKKIKKRMKFELQWRRSMEIDFLKKRKMINKV